MLSKYPLFQTHLDLAHSFWQKSLLSDSQVIDATCGNGHDTLFLLKNISTGKVYALDVQKKAIEATKTLITSSFGQIPDNLFLIEGSHENFPKEIAENSIQLIVYNLGYLPSSDKQITTMTKSTLKSVENALKLLSKGGILSITCYSGHPEGNLEEQALENFLSTLNPKEFLYTHLFIKNRREAPSLILVQKAF